MFSIHCKLAKYGQILLSFFNIQEYVISRVSGIRLQPLPWDRWKNHGTQRAFTRADCMQVLPILGGWGLGGSNIHNKLLGGAGLLGGGGTK